MAKYEIYNKFGIRRKPLVIQLPITSRCNSRCKTCNIWKYKDNIDIDPCKLKDVLSHDYFSEVTSVGINGGEITLVNDFVKIIQSVLELKSLKSIHIISNGILNHKLLQYLTEVKPLCVEKNVVLNCCLSIDGVGDLHNLVRGVPKSFDRSKWLLDEMKRDYPLYCDRFSIGCTISQDNVPYIHEIKIFLEQYSFDVEYHLAVPNKRIKTFDDYGNYDVMTDERSRLLALEFFYYMFRCGGNTLINRIRYFIIYKYLGDKTPKRLAKCEYLYRDVTIDENLNLYLCATASESAGNLNVIEIDQLTKSNKLNGIAKINKAYCDNCIHYVTEPTLMGLFYFFKALFYERTKFTQFNIASFLLGRFKL